MKIALALLFCVALIAPAIAQVIPAAPEESEARTCYMSAQHKWDTVMASQSWDVTALTGAYKTFANCATVAIQTGPVENGQHVPWSAEYFADTVGAFYAQEQLIGADIPNRCVHILLAHDLAEQAVEIAPPSAAPALEGLEEARDLLAAKECK